MHVGVARQTQTGLLPVRWSARFVAKSQSSPPPEVRDDFSLHILIVENENLVCHSTRSDTNDDMTFIAFVDSIHNGTNCNPRLRTHAGRKDVAGAWIKLMRSHSHDNFLAGLG
jgi:hypothetical protein